MVEVSRDGRRVYFTNSLYRRWDAQFYPDGIRGWMVEARRRDRTAASTFDPRFLVEMPDGLRPHQVRLAGRRRVVRLVLLRMMTAGDWPWVDLHRAAAAALHG